MDAVVDARRFVEALDRHLGDRLRAAVLFGSHARGEARADSDIDLLILLRDAPPFFDRCFLAVDVAREVSPNLPSRLSPIVYDVREAQEVRPLFYDIAIDGVVLLDRDGAWGGIRDRVLRRMKELGSERRVDADGHRYWLLAPSLPPGTPIEL
ncbi:MAG: nucleotidyltransferase domain-containing protein [Myxococcota bacterium]